MTLCLDGTAKRVIRLAPWPHNGRSIARHANMSTHQEPGKRSLTEAGGIQLGDDDTDLALSPNGFANTSQWRIFTDSEPVTRRANGLGR